MARRLILDENTPWGLDEPRPENIAGAPDELSDAPDRLLLTPGTQVVALPPGSVLSDAIMIGDHLALSIADRAGVAIRATNRDIVVYGLPSFVDYAKLLDTEEVTEKADYGCFVIYGAPVDHLADEGGPALSLRMVMRGSSDQAALHAEELSDQNGIITAVFDLPMLRLVGICNGPASQAELWQEVATQLRNPQSRAVFPPPIPLSGSIERIVIQEDQTVWIVIGAGVVMGILALVVKLALFGPD